MLKLNRRRITYPLITLAIATTIALTKPLWDPKPVYVEAERAMPQAIEISLPKLYIAEGDCRYAHIQASRVFPLFGELGVRGDIVGSEDYLFSSVYCKGVVDGNQRVAAVTTSDSIIGLINSSEDVPESIFLGGVMTEEGDDFSMYSQSRLLQDSELQTARKLYGMLMESTE